MSDSVAATCESEPWHCAMWSSLTISKHLCPAEADVSSANACRVKLMSWDYVCAVTTAASLGFAMLGQQDPDSSGRAHGCGQSRGCRPPTRGWSCQAPPTYLG